MDYNRKRRIIIAIATLVVIAAVPAAIFFYYSGGTHRAGSTAVRIGWQIPLATQGQIAQVLKRSDLLERRGLVGQFVPFSFGGPQTEAALAGELDIIFVGDQPAINLIARGGKWKIVSRLFYTRTAVLVPPGSPVQTMRDLKGRTVASPFGTVAHREATLKQQAAGLNPDKDVKNVNLDILEISNLVQSGGKSSWGQIDAVAVWEPTTSLFEQNKLARLVDATPTLGVIAVSDEFLAAHPEAAVQFLEAMREAWAYFATHTDQVNQWYIKDAHLGYSPAILDSAAKVEPNYAARSLDEVNLSLDDHHLATLEMGAEWAHQRGFTKVKANIKSAVDTSFLARAVRESTRHQFDPNQVGIRP